MEGIGDFAIRMVVVAAAVVVLGTAVAMLVDRLVKRRPPPNPLTDAEIERVAQEGDQMSAIRWYRELHDADLPTARSAVDRMLRKGQPQ